MFFLHGLHRRYRDGRYIHVLRHGLDMSYSSNDQQFTTWGPSYRIDPSDPSPRNRFEFWYRSNRQVLDLATRWFGERFLPVRLEDLCLQRDGVASLLSFAGLPNDESAQRAARGSLMLPASYCRYQKFDQSWIDGEVL